MRHITGMAAMLFLTTPVLAGEMDDEFAGKTSRSPAVAQSLSSSAAKTAGTLQTSSTRGAKATELDAESHIQAARGGGGGHGGGGRSGGGARGFSGGARGFSGGGMRGFSGSRVSGFNGGRVSGFNGGRGSAFNGAGSRNFNPDTQYAWSCTSVRSARSLSGTEVNVTWGGFVSIAAVPRKSFTSG